jgi:hypothetical protein
MVRARYVAPAAAALSAMSLALALLLIGGSQVQAQVADTDGDGVSDSTETTYGSDPTSPRSLPEHLGYSGGASCSDGIDNDLDGATDSADSGCVSSAPPPRATPSPTSTSAPSPTPSASPEASATLPPIKTATPVATATEPSIAAPTATATVPGISSGGPGGDPTAPPSTGDVQALPAPTKQPGFGVPPPPDLRITALELTQGVQDLENDMPLVDNRITYLRVYVATDDGNWYGVNAVVGAFRNGQQLGLTAEDNAPAVRFAKNGPITAHEDGGDRLNLDDSLYFRLPRHWTHGETTFRVLVYANGNPDSVELESDPDNNLRNVEATFHVGSDANVVLIPIHMHVGNTSDGDLHTYTWSANQDEATRVVEDIFRLNPVARLLVYGGEVEQQVVPSCHGGGCSPQEWDLSDPNQVALPTLRIRALKDNTDPWVENLGWYGMVDDDVTMTMQKQGFDPINLSGYAKNGVAYGQFGDSYWASSPWHLSRGATVAHELAHNLGLNHVNCSGDEDAGGTIDPNYPYENPDCSIAAVDAAGYFGLDVYYHNWPWLTEPTVISNDPEEADPKNAFPLMGYTSPTWADPYDYCLMLVGYGVPCDLDDLQIALPQSLRDAFVAAADAVRAGQIEAHLDHAPSMPSGGRSPLQTADQFALVYGFINRDTNEAFITNVQRIDDPLPHVIDEALALEAERAAAGPADYQLDLRDPNGTLVGTLPLIDFSVPNHAGVDAIQTFAELVVWPGAVDAVEVRDASDAVLAARSVSASPPVVQISAPQSGDTLSAPLHVAWDANDPDGDELTAMVQYSSDGGQTWRVIADGIDGFEVDLPSLGYIPASDGAGVIRVTVNDGVNTGRAEVGNLEVPNNGPSVRILGPGTGHRLVRGELLSLEGYATDWEDGVVPGDSLTWSSSIDGRLGEGETLDIVDLSAGEHTITLTAEDVDGAASQTSIIVTVYETLSPDRTAELRAAAARLGVTLAEPSDANDEDGWFNYVSLGVGAAAGAVVMLLVGLAFIGPRSRRSER